MEKLQELIDKSNNILTILDDDYFKDYDPDSSAIAWEYYKIMYKDTIGIKSEIKRKYGKQRQIGYFEYKKEDGKIKINQIDEAGRLVIGKIHLAGDCVFNFNEDKFERFKPFVKGNKKLFQKLLYCKKMHHSPYNFALMPTESGMNSQKGFNNYDRPDWFLCSLSKFYEEYAKSDIIEGINDDAEAEEKELTKKVQQEKYRENIKK